MSDGTWIEDLNDDYLSVPTTNALDDFFDS